MQGKTWYSPMAYSCVMSAHAQLRTNLHAYQLKTNKRSPCQGAEASLELSKDVRSVCLGPHATHMLAVLTSLCLTNNCIGMCVYNQKVLQVLLLS